MGEETEQCRLIKSYVSSYGDPLYVVIPDTFEEYFRSIRTEGRGSYRKANRRGYTVRKVERITPGIYKDLREIWLSKKIRQGRPAVHYYGVLGNGPHDVLISWPIEEYKYDCNKHYFDFHGCFLGEKMVSYVELLHSGELACVHSTMGHGDYLKDGIMKYMFIKVIEMGKFKYLNFGNYATTGLKHFFLRDIGIKEHGNPELLRNMSQL